MKIRTGEIDERQVEVIIGRYNRLAGRTIYPSEAISALSLMMVDVRTLLAAFGTEDDSPVKVQV